MSKRVIQVTLALLMAFAVLSSPAFASAKKKDSGGGGGGHGAAAAVEVQRFVTLAPLVTPIISSRRVRGRMELYLVLEIKDKEKGPEVMRKMPRLEASFVTVANNYAASLGLPTKRLDIALVMKRFQAAADRLFPPGTVKVLIQQAQYKR